MILNPSKLTSFAIAQLEKNIDSHKGYIKKGKKKNTTKINTYSKTKH